jgi:hypothetical protein
MLSDPPLRAPDLLKVLRQKASTFGREFALAALPALATASSAGAGRLEVGGMLRLVIASQNKWEGHA